uniref:RGS domain-containing protein n=1 Tax=Meloidogyne hapla TaxID=6305 RepID=A0A1I8B5C9_MELHA
MMSEPEWAPSLIPNLGRNNFIKNTNFGKNQKIAATNNEINLNLNNCSHSSSSQSTGVDCKRRALQIMAVTDSSDFTSSVLTSSIDGGIHSFNSGNVENKQIKQSSSSSNKNNKSWNCSSRPPPPPIPSQQQIIKIQLQQPQLTKTKINENKKQIFSSSSSTELPLNEKEEKEEINIKRISSLNKQQQQPQQQFIKRNSVTNSAPLTDKMQRKNQLGPFGRTFYFLKSKLDFSLSASVLCPSKEECRLWQEDFFTLLSHKYGCMLFREFLQSEFSEENLDFWLDVENFKQMKDSKKQTLQKAQQIYDTYIKELAPKEVNLDSETRMKTKNGLQSIPLKTDIFNLAQNKIEQLMSKDSYSRFLKSEQYLDLLDDIPNIGDKPRSASNGLLRVSSTKSNGSILNKRSTASRSPSLSPKLGGAGRCVRRNTCSPVSPVTLQIPCIRE